MFSQTDIAEALGVGRASVHRCLSQMVKYGEIEKIVNDIPSQNDQEWIFYKYVECDEDE